MDRKLKSEKLLGVSITTESEVEILEYITKRLQKGDKKLFIVTPNPEMLVYASKHPSFKDILNEADVVLPDGIGIVWGSRILKKGIKARITGVDMLQKLCMVLSKQTVMTGFLGGRSGVADRAVDCLQKKYSGLKVGFAGEEWNESKMASKKIDLLFVGLGFPKQEEWIYKNLDNIPVTAAMGVGGSFDFISGGISRAPFLFQKLGLEWFYRLLRQPWRIKRQLALIEYIFLILKEKYK